MGGGAGRPMSGESGMLSGVTGRSAVGGGGGSGMLGGGVGDVILRGGGGRGMFGGGAGGGRPIELKLHFGTIVFWLVCWASVRCLSASILGNA